MIESTVWGQSAGGDLVTSDGGGMRRREGASTGILKNRFAQWVARAQATGDCWDTA